MSAPPLHSVFRLPSATVVRGRHEYLIARCATKRVLHIGCVDTGLMEERFARGELLHQKLVRVATRLVGIDIDEAGIRFLRSKALGELHVADITQPQALSVIGNEAFDIILISEVVEHLANPGLFLDALPRLLLSDDARAVITVPNALSLANVLSQLRRIENVHPDHNYWFSIVTLTTLLHKHGLSTDRVLAYTFEPMFPWRKAPAVPTMAAATENERMEISQVTSETKSNIIRRIGRGALLLPRMLLAEALLASNPFWGDGLIVEAKRSG